MTIDGHDLHYVALHSIDLTPEVASAYGITRSQNRGVIVLHARLRNEDGGKSVPINAIASSRNLIGQQRKIEMRRVNEQGTHYSIGTFPIDHRERLRFSLRVGFADDAPNRELSFEQEFHTR